MSTMMSVSGTEDYEYFVLLRLILYFQNQFAEIPRPGSRQAVIANVYRFYVCVRDRGRYYIRGSTEGATNCVARDDVFY